MRADRDRQALGFLSVSETQALCEGDIRVLDPYPTLIGQHVTFATGTILYPTAIEI